LVLQGKEEKTVVTRIKNLTVLQLKLILWSQSAFNDHRVYNYFIFGSIIMDPIFRTRL